MNSIIDTIMERLAEKVPELWIDVDFGQLSVENPPVDFPCALIDIRSAAHTDTSDNGQITNARVMISVAFSVLGPSDHGAPAELRAKAMDHYRILQEVYVALQGFGTEEFAPLSRATTERKDETYPRHFIMVFDTAFADESACPVRTKPRPRPDITIEKK